MRIVIPTCCLLLFAFPSMSQDSTGTKKKATPVARQDPNNNTRLLTFQNMDHIVGHNIYGVMQRIDMRYEGVQGSPYFLTDWNAGRIDLLSGRNYENVPIKYDAHSQNLVMLRPQMRDSIIVFPSQVRQFVLHADDGAEWIFRRYDDLKTDDSKLSSSYFLVLYDGKTSLLKQVSKTFKKADYKDPYSTNVRYDSYSSDFAYYILKPDRTLTKLKKGKKSLLDALDDKAAKVESYLSQEKVDLKTDTDLAKVVKYYDGL